MVSLLPHHPKGDGDWVHHDWRVAQYVQALNRRASGGSTRKNTDDSGWTEPKILYEAHTLIWNSAEIRDAVRPRVEGTRWTDNEAPSLA